MKKYKNSKGVSFLFVIGSYGSFHFTSTKHILHLCLGWFAFTVFYYDVENALAQTLLESEKESINYLHSCEKLPTKDVISYMERQEDFYIEEDELANKFYNAALNDVTYFINKRLEENQ